MGTRILREKKPQEMLEMRQDQAHYKGMQNPKVHKIPYRLLENWKDSNKHMEKSTDKNSADRNRKDDSGREGVRKRRRLPVEDGLGSRPERKPIIIQRFYAALHNTKLWASDKDHLMIKIYIHGKQGNVSHNAMIYS